MSIISQSVGQQWDNLGADQQLTVPDDMLTIKPSFSPVDSVEITREEDQESDSIQLPTFETPSDDSASDGSLPDLVMREEDLDSSDDDRAQPDAYYTDDDSSTVDAALEARESVANAARMPIPRNIDIAEETNNNSNDDESSNDDDHRPTVRRSARVRRPNQFLADYELENENESDDEDAIMEQALVGAGIGGGFNHTSQLTAKKYNETMKEDDVDEWIEGHDAEHERMLQNKVWRARLREDVPNERPITTTWADKLKASGVKRCRVNVRGFEQIAGIHYDPDSKSSPVVNMTSIRIVLTIMAATLIWNKATGEYERYEAQIQDVKGAFLKGRFTDDEKPIFIEVPQGFQPVYLQLAEEMEQRKRDNNPMTEQETHDRTFKLFEEWQHKPQDERRRIAQGLKNPKGGVAKLLLELLRTMYGSVQAAKAFWREMLAAFHMMGYKRSSSDPCLYYKWELNKLNVEELSMWLSWIDDCVAIGTTETVQHERTKMGHLFDCDDIGPLEEYIGTKVDVEPGKIKLTQPVLLQSFVDEFGAKANKSIVVPAIPGKALRKCEEGEALSATQHKRYRSGVGKLNYLGRWSRPDILNQVRELSRHMQAPNEEHYKAMMRCMDYCVTTKERGLLIEPNQHWNGRRDDTFTIVGYSDSDYAKCTQTRRSVSGNTTTFNGVPVITRSTMQETVKLSVTEAELESATSNVQDMLFVKETVESLELTVQLPMVLYVDNKGVKDIVDNWSVGGRTRHIATKMMFLRELKEKGIIVVKHQPGEDMRSDMLTKNLPGPIFNKHIEHYITDELIGEQRLRESVGSENNQDQGRHEVFQPLIPNTSSRHKDPTQQDTKDQKDRHNDKYEQQGTVEGESILSIGIADGYNPVSMIQPAQDNKLLLKLCNNANRSEVEAATTTKEKSEKNNDRSSEIE